MAEPFLGEIRLMSFIYPPRAGRSATGRCCQSTRTRPSSPSSARRTAETALTTFALPDLRGHVPLGVGNGHSLGESGGEYAHTLSVSELPKHAHAPAASGTASTGDPAGAVWADPGKAAYGNGGASALHPGSIGTTGGSDAHPHMQPYLTLSYCIALQGIFPSQY